MRLEPYEGKLSRTVLRGVEGSNVLCLLDYCSVERCFDPSLEERPVIIMGNGDNCVVARSDESKSLGITMGAPYFQIEELVKAHDIAVFSSNYPLYGDMSARMMSVLAGEVPELEVY